MTSEAGAFVQAARLREITRILFHKVQSKQGLRQSLVEQLRPPGLLLLRLIVRKQGAGTTLGSSLQTSPKIQANEGVRHRAGLSQYL